MPVAERIAQYAPGRGQDPETPAARLSRDWQESTARSDDVIQVIEDRCTLDEDLAAHEDQPACAR